MFTTYDHNKKLVPNKGGGLNSNKYLTNNVNNHKSH